MKENKETHQPRVSKLKVMEEKERKKNWKNRIKITKNNRGIIEKKWENDKIAAAVWKRMWKKFM